MVEAREEGKLTDEAAFHSQPAVAVDEIVRSRSSPESTSSMTAK